MLYSKSKRLVVYAQGEFGKGRSKTAEGVIRYGNNPVVAVVDSTEAGKSLESTIGLSNRLLPGGVASSDIPIVSTINECLKLNPEAMIIGAHRTGGALPEYWRPDIKLAIESGLDIINGLHHLLSEDPEFSECAARHGTRLFDVRKSPEDLLVASGKAASVGAMTVLTVGSDCSVGKMTTSLELKMLAEQLGHRASFIATGQTGIMIAGEGIAIDRVIGDFMAGATEQMVLQAAEKYDFVFVEGQGSLVHPGYSGVTLALLHGACPKAMILCHKVGRDSFKCVDMPVPSLTRLIPLYESVASSVRHSKVLAVSLNTSGLGEDAAQRAISQVEREIGLPATDPIRYGAEKLFKAVVEYREGGR